MGDYLEQQRIDRLMCDTQREDDIWQLPDTVELWAARRYLEERGHT